MAGIPNADSPRKKRKSPGRDLPEQAPPAKPLTLVLFYLLIAGTAAMAVWALASIIR